MLPSCAGMRTANLSFTNRVRALQASDRPWLGPRLPFFREFDFDVGIQQLASHENKSPPG